MKLKIIVSPVGMIGLVYKSTLLTIYINWYILFILKVKRANLNEARYK